MKFILDFFFNPLYHNFKIVELFSEERNVDFYETAKSKYF